jgi:hypothetical protein
MVDSAGDAMGKRTKTALAIATTTLIASVSAPAFAVVLYTTPGDMRDLDVGADGDVFAIGRPNIAGSTNGQIYTWIRGSWHAVGGAGRRIAVDPQGIPWIVNSNYQVWRYRSGFWLQEPGVVRDLDIGADGSMYALGEPSWTDGRVYRWTGSNWTLFGGSGTAITVDRDGHPWVVNSSGQIWRHNGTSWVLLPGTARDIDAGADGTVYMLTAGGTDGVIYRWNGSGWTYNGDSGVRIAVSPTGSPNVVRASGVVRSGFVNRLHGDTTCSPNETDCNVCAVDVRRQLDDAFDHNKMYWKPESWHLDWTSTYPPQSTSPQTPFDDGEWPVSSHHVQGFVRTGSNTHPYAGSTSDDVTGAVFVLSSSNSSPGYDLRSIHMANESEEHPSGVHALGNWVILSDDGKLRFINVDWTFSTTRREHEVSGLVSAGGGIGIARLGVGSYALISTIPGSIDSRPRENSIWQLEGDIATPGALSVTHLSTQTYQPHPDWVREIYIGWEADYRFSENLSVITECETGQLYTLHATGPNEVWGTGYFRLSRLEEGPNGLVLRSLDVYGKSQDMNNCYLRASGTAYANDQGIIDLYCHAYDPRNEWLETAENVPFYRGIGYYSSCFNRCGGGAPSGCYCDAACSSYGDCCADKAALCGS